MGKKINKINLLLAAIWAGIIIACAVHLKDFSVEQVLSFAPEDLISASLIMCGLFFLKSLSIFIYSGILFTVNGIIFPMWLAIVMDAAGIAIMSTAPFFLPRQALSLVGLQVRMSLPQRKARGLSACLCIMG